MGWTLRSARFARALMDIEQILSISRFPVRARRVEQLLGRNKFQIERDLFRTSDAITLPLFDDAHELARIHQRCMRAGIEPGEAAAENLDMQALALEIGEIDV